MGTDTKVQRETPDAPTASWLGRTQTFSAVAREPSDADVNEIVGADLALASRAQFDTLTKVQRETND